MEYFGGNEDTFNGIKFTIYAKIGHYIVTRKNVKPRWYQSKKEESVRKFTAERFHIAKKFPNLDKAIEYVHTVNWGFERDSFKVWKKGE